MLLMTNLALNVHIFSSFDSKAIWVLRFRSGFLRSPCSPTLGVKNRHKNVKPSHFRFEQKYSVHLPRLESNPCRSDLLFGPEHV